MIAPFFWGAWPAGIGGAIGRWFDFSPGGRGRIFHPQPANDQQQSGVLCGYLICNPLSSASLRTGVKAITY